MTTEDNPQASPPRQDGWSGPVDTLQVDGASDGLTTINVQGKHPIGAMQGFGQFWKKAYTLRLEGVTQTPQEIMDVWKARFPDFQPPGNRFIPPKEGIQPGKVLLIDSPLPIIPGLYKQRGVVPMTSGVMVMFVDDTSFGVMTPEGFPVAGWNNFLVFEDDDGVPAARVMSFERASDPIYEFGFRLMGGARRQEFIWKTVLTRLAEHFGVTGEVVIERELLDPDIQWKEFGRVTQNAGIRTTLYYIAAPVRWVLRLFK